MIPGTKTTPAQLVASADEALWSPKPVDATASRPLQNQQRNPHKRLNSAEFFQIIFSQPTPLTWSQILRKL